MSWQTRQFLGNSFANLRLMSVLVSLHISCHWTPSHSFILHESRYSLDCLTAVLRPEHKIAGVKFDHFIFKLSRQQPSKNKEPSYSRKRSRNCSRGVVIVPIPLRRSQKRHGGDLVCELTRCHGGGISFAVACPCFYLLERRKAPNQLRCGSDGG